MEGSERRCVENTIQFPSAGLTIRQKEPKNLEAPFDRIDSYLTPTELFYIRSHFPIPALDRASYKLRIDGAVRRPKASKGGSHRKGYRVARRGPHGDLRSLGRR
jgi:hypothetical protein